MKKVIFLAFVAMVSFLLVACDSVTTSPKEGTTTTTTTTAYVNQDVEALKTQLIAAGYELDKRDADSVAYYNENAVNLRYDITVTVTDVYLGYINQVEQWCELVGFYSESDAMAFTAGIDAVDQSGMLYFRHGSAVVITYAETTIAALS